MKYATTINDKTYLIDINDDRHVTLDGVEYEVDFANVNDQPIFTLLINGQSYEAFVYEGDENWDVLLRGQLYNVSVEDERERRLRAMAGMGPGHHTGDFNLKAPMPGLIVSVLVSEGQEVKKGETLVILESMKMQNELKTPRPGKISQIKVAAGTSVEQNQVMIVVA